MVDANLNVDDACVVAYNRLKLTKDIKFVTYKVEGQSNVIVERVGELESTYQDFVHSLPQNEPRFAVYDFDYTADDGITSKKIVFIHWSPDNSTVKNKMIYASSKENLKRRFAGIHREVQACSLAEVEQREIAQALR
ncbi:unnamed protein product [Blepharisma stoltei]|uniref:ADF-H domain-containing protein n=1 Tax=Blepharisma stoltei TaxID=1481888 RepID=A0AAU9I855_9CILI|nr:unnamed protein product [Blepharisma stoltei]